MIDTQKRQVLSAIQAASLLATEPVDFDRACSVLGVDREVLTVRDDAGMAVSRSRIELSRTAKPMTALHALAHFATPDIFPAHGSEFCQNLLEVTRALYPEAASALEAGFEEGRVHYSDDHRRRAVIKAVDQRAVDGTSRVEAVFSSPPQRVEGRFRYDRRAGKITVNEEDFELDRLRYLWKVS